MLGSSALEVLIGVLLLFLVLSVIASAAAEIISQLLALRSRTLHDAISAMLFSADERDKVFGHPLIKSLSHQGELNKLFGRKARPSYIPKEVFAQALLENLSISRNADGSLVVRNASGQTINADLDKLMKSLAAPLGDAVAEAGRLQAAIEKWYDDSMDRVQGWYKRKTQLVLLAIGVVIVIWANANVLRYASALATNPSARDAVVAAAESAVASPSATGSASPAPSASPEPSPAASPAVGQPLTTEQALAHLAKLDFAIGWDSASTDASRHLPTKLEELPAAVGANLLGWLFAIAAVSMGAPFWFDLLKNIVNLRNAGAPPKTDEDR